MGDEEGFITTPELCEWLRVSKSTVSRWRGSGLPHYGKTKAFRYRKSEVLNWLESQQKDQDES